MAAVEGAVAVGLNSPPHQSSSISTSNKPPAGRNITTVTLTEEHRSPSRRSASTSRAADKTTSSIEEKVRRDKASTLPTNEKHSRNAADTITSHRPASGDSRTVTLNSVSQPSLTATSSSTESSRTGAVATVSHVSVKPKTYVNARNNNTPAILQNSQGGSHNIRQSSRNPISNADGVPNTSAISNVRRGTIESNANENGSASVMSYGRHSGTVNSSHGNRNSDHRNVHTTAVTVVTARGTLTSTTSQSKQTPNSITSSSQTLPLTVARGTVASVCVNNRTRNASPSRNLHSSRQNRNQLRSQSSSPSRPRTDGQGHRTQPRSGGSSQRVSNQNRSRDTENGNRLGSSSSGSEHSSHVNIPRGLDANQLSVDVLQSTHQTSGTPSSPTHSILQWCETNEALPDILNSHVLPPYGAPRQNQHRNVQRSRTDQQTRNQSRAHRHRSTQGITQIEGGEKDCCSRNCCLRCVTLVTTFRWVLVFLAILGVVCVAVGIVLGSLHMTTQRTFLIYSLMFIGLGVMLVVVVGSGWRCTPQGHEPCHMLCRLGTYSSDSASRAGAPGRSRRDRSEWHGGVMYSEFRHRRPPPSYNASQDYQQRLVTSRSQVEADGTGPPEVGDDLSLPSSPPPTYRSRASTTRPGIHITFPPPHEDYPSSRPPTYRSHAGECERPGLSSITQSDNTVSNANSNALPPNSVDWLPMPNVNSESNSILISASTIHRANEACLYLDSVLSEQNIDLSISPSPDSISRTSVENGDCTLEVTENLGQIRTHINSSDTYRIEVTHIGVQPQINVIGRTSNTDSETATLPQADSSETSHEQGQSDSREFLSRDNDISDIAQQNDDKPVESNENHKDSPKSIKIMDVGTQTGNSEDEEPEVADTQL